MAETITVATIWLLINIQYHPSGAVKGIDTSAYKTKNGCEVTLKQKRPTMTGDAWCLAVEVRNE